MLESGELNAVHQSECETLRIGVDSGASVTIIPAEVASDYPLMPSKESMAGVQYKTATGDKVEDLGCRTLQLLGGSSSGSTGSRGLRARVGKVSKSLLAVCEMVDAGHDVVFCRRDGKDCSNAIHKKTSKRTNFTRRNGVYELEMNIVPYRRQGELGSLQESEATLEATVAEIEEEVLRDRPAWAR